VGSGSLWVVLRVFGWVCWGFLLGLFWPPLYTPGVIRSASRFSFSLIKLLIIYQKKNITRNISAKICDIFLDHC
jgi:hypothetical protein